MDRLFNDVVLDAIQNIWIIEINLLHQYEMARYIYDDPGMYERVVQKPLDFVYRKAIMP